MLINCFNILNSLSIEIFTLDDYKNALISYGLPKDIIMFLYNDISKQFFFKVDIMNLTTISNNLRALL